MNRDPLDHDTDAQLQADLAELADVIDDVNEYGHPVIVNTATGSTWAVIPLGGSK